LWFSTLQVQRYLGVPNLRVAQKAIWLSGVSITLILSVVSYAGKRIQI
jgi:hypothetical protein